MKRGRPSRGSAPKPFSGSHLMHAPSIVGMRQHAVKSGRLTGGDPSHTSTRPPGARRAAALDRLDQYNMASGEEQNTGSQLGMPIVVFGSEAEQQDDAVGRAESKPCEGVRAGPSCSAQLGRDREIRQG